MMQMEIGSIFEGKVTKVAAFGAFVALPDGKSGMVHISELSESYVRDINAVVHTGDILRVRLIAVDERGRLSLSVRQALTEEERAAARAKQNAERRRPVQAAPAHTDAVPGEYTPYVRNPKASTGDRFEDMMNRFKTVSDEKISDLRKYSEGRHGASSRSKGSRRT